MPWRVKTLTEYRTSEGASPEGTDNMPVSDDLSLSVAEQLGNAETSDFLSGGGALDDGAFGDGELGRHELPWDSTTGPNHGQAQLVSRNCAALALGASQVPRGPVISESSFEQLLSHAYLGTRGQLTVKMPWERGVFKKVFQKPATGIQHVFQQPRIWVNYNLESVAETLEDLHEPTAKRPELVGAFFEHALTAVSDLSFHQQRTGLLETAVEKWFCIITVNMLASSTGRDIISFGNMDDQKRGAFETIEAVIGIRSRTTAITRANSLLKFLRWRAECSDNDGRPFEEQEAWQYLKELRETGAAPTKGSSFLSACAYAFHVFGFNDLESICNSKRLKGLADLMHAVKAPLKQALVLTIRQVLMLHELLDATDCNVVDRAVAAYLLVALYERCRHSDLQNIEDVFIDLGPEGEYLEITTRTHKTSRTASQKSRLLPVVLPAIGVQGREWITAAKMAFKDYGLSLEGHIGGPLFRPPGADGNSHCKRGLTSQEVSRFLRVMLGENMTHDKESGPKLSSHSLKATVLSWAAKAGMAAQDKSILGRHVSAYTDSSAVYARDLSIGAVSRLQEVVLQIYRGEFLPDAPRSGYYPVAMPVVEAPELPDAEVIKVEDDAACQELDMEVPVADSQLCEEACSASSDGSESLEGSDSEEEIVPPAPKCYRHVAAGPLEGKFVMHKVSHLVHYVDSGVKGGLATKVISCGRALNNNYKTVERFDTVDVCRRCKTNATKDGLLPKPAV